MSARAFREEAVKSRFKGENQFEAWVISILRVNGWRITSMKDSRKQRWDTDKGIEDIHATRALALANPSMLYAELKMPGNKPTPSQELWLDQHRVISDKINHELGYEMIAVRVWYPQDEEEIIRTAGGKVPLG